MGEICIGTSGYSYSDWKGVFYPEGTPQTGFLQFYAQRFPVVELNFSYYTQPREEAVRKMAESTPENFLFTIKGHQSLTHLVSSNWEQEVDTFTKGISPLVELNKLAAVVLQFPFSFHYKPNNRNYLSELCDALRSLPTVIEFRNAEWQVQRVFTAMEEKHLGYVCTDTPDIEGLPLNTAVVTSDIGYIRFHGRNRDNWWSGDSAGRYDYSYTRDDLDGWIDKIDAIAAKTTILVITFNNHIRGQAVQNAVQLKSLLKSRENLTIR